MILSQYHIFELDTINIYNVLWHMLLSCKLLSAPAVGIQDIYVQIVPIPKYPYSDIGPSQN